ncbi:MAG: beta-lactamase family protein [Gemmatimonadetes bacterium]|nr:beta-lactamase family protein [Gemmatimonadota bacterium]GIS79751.1 MAG: serine hydrolase [Gammaproteobacteria bacterium]
MRTASSIKALLFSTCILSVACGVAEEEIPNADGSTESLIARAQAFELDTEYNPPPGEALHHQTAGFAKILCSGVFITGLDAADAAANVGGFISPFDERRHVVDTVVDYEQERVALTLPDGVTRTAKRYENQGCVAHGIGEDSVHFVPTTVERNLPPAATTPWPMGDVLSDAPWPSEIDMEKVEEALDIGFGPAEARTLGLVVTYKGRILGERYGEGIDIHTPLESWSMTKSLTGTLMGVLIEQGTYELWQPAPVPEWQEPGDPRQEIRIGDIMRMSSGIKINAPSDPDYDRDIYADHYYLYTATSNSYEWAATRPQEWPPNTIGRYRNTDPVLTSYLIRLGVEGRGQDYHSFPQHDLFDKIGIRDGLIETDPQGNFLGQGLAFMPARDWVRLGNLYLQDGVWDGERILPEGYVEYASTLAPTWVSDGRLQYGGAFFWVNGQGSQGLPESAYSMRGAGGQSTTIIPTHDLVVVRLGKYTGSGPGGQALNQAFGLLMEAVPPIE